MRIITRGAKTGICNICGNFGPLTDDHIPPKGVSRLTQVSMLNIVELLSADSPKKTDRFSQNGVKYRTLCGKCNNERLGIHYDPTLISFTKEVGSYLESSLALPAKMTALTKVNRLMRSLVGHLLAQGVNEHRAGTLMDELTTYFLDESSAFPENLRVYYWIYPYNDQAIVKCAALSLHYWNSFATFMLLKFYPFAFFFVSEEPAEWRIPYRRLDTMLTPFINDQADVWVNFQDLPARRWPEAPSDIGIALYGDSAIGAIARPQKAIRSR